MENPLEFTSNFGREPTWPPILAVTILPSLQVDTLNISQVDRCGGRRGAHWYVRDSQILVPFRSFGRWGGAATVLIVRQINHHLAGKLERFKDDDHNIGGGEARYLILPLLGLLLLLEPLGFQILGNWVPGAVLVQDDLVLLLGKFFSFYDFLEGASLRARKKQIHGKQKQRAKKN